MPSFRSPIDVGLPNVPDGVPDEFVPIFQNIFAAIRILQQTLGDYSGANFGDPQYLLDNPLSSVQTFQTQNLQILLLPCNAAIAKGLLVNLFDSGGGIMKARLASGAAMATRAHGVALNATTAAGQTQIVAFFSGYFGGYAGFTPGVTYYLSAVTPGVFTNTAPVAVGTIAQEVGVALSGSEFLLNITRPIQN